MARPPSILCLLLITLSGIDALMVTTTTSPISVLRWQNVTIPCNITGMNVDKPIAVDWKRRLENGTEVLLLENENGHIKVYRPGSLMESDIREGNAALHMPGVEFSDEGEYTCIVTNTPNEASGKTSLQVSAIPSSTVRDTSIELGTEKTVMCDVHNFYPKDIRIHWNLYRKGSSETDFFENSIVHNPDGTFSIQIPLTLKPRKEDDGNIYSCVVNHRSLQSELSKNFTLTVPDKENSTGTIVGSVFGTLLCTLLLVACVVYYLMGVKKDPPTLSAITGNDVLTDMSRTTLTCQIMSFRPDDITVFVCLRRRDQPEEETIYTWRSRDRTPSARLTRGGICVSLGAQEEHNLVNGAARQHERPLQLEVVPVVSRSKLRSYSCQCSLHITPSYDLDNGAELSIYVTHPALKSPKSVGRRLHVTGVAPTLLKIMTPKHIIHDELVTLTCPINGFKPRSLSITWWKRDRRGQETELITWDSGEYATHNPKYSHDVSENEHGDKCYSYLSTLTMRPDLREDDGATYICRTFHPATQQQSEEQQEIDVTAVPVLDPIQKGQESVYFGEKMDLSCKIHSFYPSPITVAWYIEDDNKNKVSIPSAAREPLEESNGFYHVTTSISYTPILKDMNKVFRCEVLHDSLSKPKDITWTLTELTHTPHVSEIQSDPAEPETGQTIILSCTASDMCPDIQSVQWNQNKSRLSSEKWITNFQEDPESRMFSGTSELTLTLTAADHGALISLDITHSGRAIKREFTMLLKGFPVVSEITSDPRIGEYGRPLILHCHVTGCDLRDITRVTWACGEEQLTRGQQKQTGDTGESLACTLIITLTAEDYSRLYTCSVHHRNMTQPITRTICLQLPEKLPTLSDIMVHPVMVRAGQKTSFQVTVSGFSPRNILVKWYRGFKQFPNTAVRSFDPWIGKDNLYTLSSTLRYPPSRKDDKVSIRCEVTHYSTTSTIREKHYVLNLTDQSEAEYAMAPGDEENVPFAIRKIDCLTGRPRVGEEITLVGHVDGCDTEYAQFFWYKGNFPIDGEIDNQQDGSGCTSTITFTAEDSATDCTIRLEVIYNYQTTEETYNLRLV
ncbi:uncharacterized protein [Hyperolius riggenbachi]|uniref:uncharacterized protein n=1 Tax=Hyperolius riggenbachi TaxID=752182 RepID=UPI0035A3138C